MFLERFNKVTFRDFTHNTRLNINNNNYQEQGKVKRDRQISYWRNIVTQNFLPPISSKLKQSSELKRQQFLAHKSQTTNIKALQTVHSESWQNFGSKI